MKHLFIIALLCNLYTQAQGVKFFVVQDLKLATKADDHGNEPWTTDVRLEVLLEGDKIGSTGHLVLGVLYEYADLSGGKLQRYGLQGGYTFSFLKFMEFTPLVIAAQMNRMNDSDAFASFELAMNLEVPITRWLNFTMKPTLMQRGDLLAKYDDPAGTWNPMEWSPNFYVGVTFFINKRARECKKEY